MEIGANENESLLLVLIQMKGLVEENKGNGVLLVIQKPKNQEMLVIVEVMPLRIKLRHLR